MTTERPFPESNQERVYVFDTDVTPGIGQAYMTSLPSHSETNTLLPLWIKLKTPITCNLRHNHPRKKITAPTGNLSAQLTSLSHLTPSSNT